LSEVFPLALDPHDKGVDYVEFAAPDFGPMKAFYGAVFGREFTDYGPEYCAFEDGRLAGGFRKGDPAGGTSLVLLFAHDLEGVQDAVRAAGGTITQEIFSFPGGRRFHFRDPVGNALAVWSFPAE
jgi:predicted enzyme related to lactoylglutathione lyase